MDDPRVVEFRDEEAQADAVLRIAYHPADDDFGTLAVEIRAPGLTFSEGVLSGRGDGIEHFFASLAEDWRGWDGTREWHTLEHGMSIEATHRGSRVALLFIVRHEPADSWQVRFPVRVAPGESLSRLASATATLFE